MKTILKTAGLFLFFVLFLSIMIREKTLFGHIYQVISPGTQQAQRIAESVVNNSMEATQRYSKKLFENSLPKVKDAVRLKHSAPMRETGRPEESIMAEEKEELDELIKTQK